MSVRMTVAELLDEFSLFEDWDEKFQYIIELGNELPPLPPQYRCDSNLVQGCTSRVWLVANLKEANLRDENDQPHIEFHADSDSQIVKGLIAILVMLLSDKTPEEILETDLQGIFAKLDLKSHLSRSRSNGLNSMILRIQTLAKLAAHEVEGEH